jgi:hypothetical protein
MAGREGSCSAAKGLLRVGERAAGHTARTLHAPMKKPHPGPRLSGPKAGLRLTCMLRLMSVHQTSVHTQFPAVMFMMYTPAATPDRNVWSSGFIVMCA